MHNLKRHGVVVDERKPDVIRVAPAPLYNSFEDVWLFVEVFRRAVGEAEAEQAEAAEEEEAEEAERETGG